MTASSVNWASGPFDGDVFGTLEVLEQALPVSLIATFEPQLFTCSEADTASAVLAQPELKAFDHIPVRGHDGSITGVLERKEDHARLTTESVATVMRQLHESLLISSNSGILSYVEEADRHPFRMVLKGSRICGIVTLSDLQKLAVRPVLFYRVTHLELLLAEWLRLNRPNDSWLRELAELDLLDSERGNTPKKIEREWSRKNEHNLAIDRLSCTDLVHKIDAVVACNAKSPFTTRSSLKDDLDSVRWLRNNVCHAGDYALTLDTAKRTAAAARMARELIEEFQTILGIQRDR